MNSKHKALLLTTCAILLVVATVLGTVAYLTDADTVVNTFTVGNVAIELHETGETTTNGVTGNAYHLLPGHTYTKDPTVTVVGGSEDAYVRMLVKVKNYDQLIQAMPATKTENETKTVFPEFYNNGIFLLQYLCGGWDSSVWTFTKCDIATDSKIATYEFRYVGNDTANKGYVVKSDSLTKLPALFKTITVPGAIKNTELALLDAVEIEVTAHAIQADGFKNAAEAWDAWSN